MHLGGMRDIKKKGKESDLCIKVKNRDWDGCKVSIEIRDGRIRAEILIFH